MADVPPDVPPGEPGETKGDGGDGGDGGGSHKDDFASLIAEMQAGAVAAEASALADEKARLMEHLQQRRDTIAMRVQVMRLKHAAIQSAYDRSALCVILLSAVTATIEIVKGELDWNDKETTPRGLYHTMQMIPALTATVTGLIAAVQKFRRLQERAEGLGRVTERAVSIISRLQRMQEQVAARRTLQELDQQSDAVTEILDETATVLTIINSVLKYADVVKHMPSYHQLTLSYLEEEKQFRLRTQVLLRGREEVHIPGGPTLTGTDPAKEEVAPRRKWCPRWWGPK